MAALLTCEQALALVAQKIATAPRPATEAIALQHARNRVLAQTITADRDQPPFPRSTRDGYAVRSADISTPIKVIGSIRAGESWTGPALQPGQAIEIMTGAPAPSGADAVVMLEHVTLHNDTITLHPHRTITAGENIVPRAAEARTGDALLHSGARITAAEIALAASVGAAHIGVFAQPTAAILATGDELVPIDATPQPMQIRNSNSHGLAALVAQHGGIPHVLPPAADTRASLHAAITSARSANMLILTGGVSAGKYDLVEEVLATLNAEFFFTGIAIQPGKPAVFGCIPATASRPDQWIFGLPGNPVSTQVTATLFAMPMLRALGGEANPSPAFANATLTEPVTVKLGLTRFLPAYMHSTLQGAQVRTTHWQGSGDLGSNARANCYLVVPPDADSLPPGANVTVLLRTQ